MKVWKLSEGKNEWLFTTRDLALRSVKMSYSSLPNNTVEDGGGNTIVVSYTDVDGSGVWQMWFHIELIIDREVYDRVEHL